MKSSVKKLVGGVVSLIVIALAAIFGYDYILDNNGDGYPQLPLEEYYESAEGLIGEELREFLTELVSTNVIPVTYGDARQALAEADADPNNPGKVLTIYSRESVDAEWNDGNNWTREHVWPNSRLGVDRVENHQANIASDLHNLRAIVQSVNSSRGNKIFSDETGPDTYYPGDADKGDVARILFYMVIRYPSLELVDEVLPKDSEDNYTPEGAKMAVLTCLLRWHREDPPDDFERQRNEVIYRRQKNRNPFIDHPEFVEMIFGN